MLLLYDLIGLQRFHFIVWRRTRESIGGTRRLYLAHEGGGGGASEQQQQYIKCCGADQQRYGECVCAQPLLDHVVGEWSRGCVFASSGRIITIRSSCCCCYACKSFASRLSLINRATNGEQAPCLWHSTGKWSRWAVTTPPIINNTADRVCDAVRRILLRRGGGGGGKASSSISADDPRADEDAFVEPPKRAFIQTRSIGKIAIITSMEAGCHAHRLIRIVRM